MELNKKLFYTLALVALRKTQKFHGHKLKREVPLLGSTRLVF